MPQIKMGDPIYLTPTHLSDAQTDESKAVTHPTLDAEVLMIPEEVKTSEKNAAAIPAARTPQATPVPTHPPKSADSAVLATYQQPSSLPVTGYAMYYNPNIMQEVLHYRLELGQVAQCGECIGNVALLRAGDLNRRVWLQWQDGSVEGPFLVVDVAARHHVAQLLQRNWVVDVDNRTAMRRGMAGPVWVTVWGAPPAGPPVAPPFAPLYAALPPENGVAASTPLPLVSATPFTELEVVQQGFPTTTPVPTITPLPIINATLNNSAEPKMQASGVEVGFATGTAVPTVTPLPVIDSVVTETQPVVHGGFPTETPVPTVTPLPFIGSISTPEQAVATSQVAVDAAVDTAVDAAVDAIDNATPLPIIAATQTLSQAVQAVAPTTLAATTLTATPTPTAAVTVDGQGTPPAEVVIPRGFPTETPIPTITPLPVITPQPSPTPVLAD